MKAIITVALPLLALFAPVQAQAQAQERPYSPAQVAQYRVPDLNGTWYMNGDPNQPCEVRQRWGDRRALFINERGESAWGTINGDRIWVPDWEGYNHRPGLEGSFRGDQIVWFNGSFWSANAGRSLTGLRREQGVVPCRRCGPAFFCVVRPCGRLID